MENRSFDHLLGWLPAADGRQAGLFFKDKSSFLHSAYPLAPDFTGCGHPNPDHSYDLSRVAYDNGAMDGFLRAGDNDLYCIGYYRGRDLPFLAAAAWSYVVCDRYFAAILGPTLPNRVFQWAAQTDRLDDSLSVSNLPTIFDSLASAGISHRYYFSNVPFLALWGLRYLFSSAAISQFFLHAALGALPAVSFVDPNFTILDDGTGNDDQPHADVRNGDAFLAKIFHAVTTGPAWRKTVLIITFDEWGGFYEHAAPPRAVAPNNVDPDQVNGQALLGFRVPAIIVSPFTRNHGLLPMVNHTVFDHTSILKFIEWRWRLASLTARDASPQIGNLASTMDFASPDARIPLLPNPSPVFGVPCFQGGTFETSPETSENLLGARTTPDRSLRQPSPWPALARARGTREWMQHPNFSR